MRRCFAIALVVLAAGGGTASASDWTRFGYDAQRSNSGPERTGIGVRQLKKLNRLRVKLPGTVDSSPVYLARVRVRGQRRDAYFATTSYGITLAIDADSGRVLWQFTPRGIAAWEGGPQITETSPVADPDRRSIYAASPDGLIHKLSVASGRELPGWPARVTLNGKLEKLNSSLNLAGKYVLVATGGYFDTPPYQGHVVAIERTTGRVAHVFNSLCSDRQDQLMDPFTCPSSDAAIWGRAGVVVIPGSHRLLVTTGNAPWNGFTDWGNSVLMMAPGASRLLQSYTPANHEALNAEDDDLGSTSPALLPLPGRGKPRYAHLVQGGKDFKARLLSLDHLGGTPVAGPRTGGELHGFGGSWVFTAPAVWRFEGRVFLFAADGAGTTAYEFRGHYLRLHRRWRHDTPGSSPVVAGGLLYVYDQFAGEVNVYRPISGHRVATLRAGPGHWNSPIVADGRIALGEGNANKHRRSGILDIWTR